MDPQLIGILLSLLSPCIGDADDILAIGRRCKFKIGVAAIERSAVIVLIVDMGQRHTIGREDAAGRMDVMGRTFDRYVWLLAVGGETRLQPIPSKR